MRIALFCPFSLGPARGNITSVRRISRNLQLIGCSISLITLDQPDLTEQLERLYADPPDILHGFHAYHSGPAIHSAAARLQAPYIITLTGSDLFDPTFRNHDETLQAIHDAALVTCFDPLVAQVAAEQFPQAAAKLKVIPQGVEPFPNVIPRTTIEKSLAILLPAALRPVKGIDWAIEQLEPLATQLPHLQLWIAGGVLDTDYAEWVCALAADRPWVHLLGEIPYQAMGSLYTAADLVLNSSLFEGGMANALLEAMVMGRPVLARDIPGNRSLIDHGKTGWLYDSGEMLRELILGCLQQPDQYRAVGLAAQQQVKARFSPEQEAQSLVRLYQRLGTTT